jgi:hypothetical protein
MRMLLPLLGFALSGVLSAQTFPMPGPSVPHPAAAPAGPTVVQGCGYFSPNNPVTSIACTFSNPLTAGNQLYVCVNNVVSTNASISFTGDSGTFTIDPVLPFQYTWAAASGGQVNNVSCYYVLSLSGGGTTLTAAAVGGAGAFIFPTIVAVEIHGGHGIDQSDLPSSSASGSTGVTNSVTTIHAVELAIGFATPGSLVTITASAGFTQQALATYSNGAFGQMESAAQTSIGSVAATWTFGSSTDYLAHIVTWY